MKVIIAGSREVILVDLAILDEAVPDDVTEVVSGTARGGDQCGEQWADIRNIPVKRFPANWNEYGKSAGYRRNAEMAEYGDYLVALWDGKSRGTKNMIALARKAGLGVEVVYFL